jgi:hypothetical protein
MFKLWLVSFFLFTAPQAAQAKKFSNSYLAFELPDQWDCQLRKRAYLCRYRVSKLCRADRSSAECQKQIQKSREALIVMTAKEKSEVDSLSAFRSHFGESRKLDATGGTTQSKVIHNKTVSIKKLQWIDGMHLGSELPHYYTRYLATIHGDVAVLISFSAHKMFYSNYSNQFFQGIKTLEVTTKDLKKVSRKELAPKILSRPIDIPDDLFNAPPESSGGNGTSTLLFLLSMALAAAGIYLWIRNKKSA